MSCFTMELLNEEEILFSAKQCGFSKVNNWKYAEFQDKVIGYLGDHLNLIIEVESNGNKSELKLFVKCMPRFDKWKSDYLKELSFFKKEYIMLSQLFKEFENGEGSNKWRPNLLFIKEDVFVFENVSLQGYKMPHHQETLNFDEIKATVATLAKFHSQSYIFEERKSKELNRPYRIWEDYKDYLQEPCRGKDWRDVGRNAVIDFLKVFSKYKSKPNCNRYLEAIVPGLFDRAMELMKPSSEYRNVVVHRDMWSNNIFLKEINSEYHAMIVDFQTVIYCSPMLDLSSLIYFNTSRTDKDDWTDRLIDFYYTILTDELRAGGVHVEDIIDKKSIVEAYEKSLAFAVTQAGLITPIIAMSKDKREETFCNPEAARIANVVSRSRNFIEIAEKDDIYRTRVMDLLDEMVERFVFPKDSGINLNEVLNY